MKSDESRFRKHLRQARIHMDQVAAPLLHETDELLLFLYPDIELNETPDRPSYAPRGDSPN